MSIDLNLCRELLTAAAEGASTAICAGSGESELQALSRAGLVELGTDQAGGCVAERVTAAGREFLRLAGNDVLWKRVLGEFAAGGRPVSLDMVRARLLEWAQFS